MIPPEKIQPNSNFILVRKCATYDKQSDGTGLIDVGNGKSLIIPDFINDTTNFCEIIAVGPKCVMVTKADIGKTIMVPEYHNHLHCVDSEEEEYWMVRECELKNKKRSQERISDVRNPVIVSAVWDD